MINLRSGQWNLHREGIPHILAGLEGNVCEGADTATVMYIRLYTSANEPGCADELADYTEADFTGYGEIQFGGGGTGECVDVLEFGVNIEGIAQIVIDQQTFEVGTPVVTTNTINGAYLAINVGGVQKLLATFPFAVPVPMEETGDILKVGGFLLMDCQMVPVA